jgi:hypothetical protein
MRKQNRKNHIQNKKGGTYKLIYVPTDDKISTFYIITFQHQVISGVLRVKNLKCLNTLVEVLGIRQ